ncbi:PucR family transcriptional regulator [Mycobacterium sp. CBMA 234]|nr:PucR family transcriptional regulator [Mycolicibacterium sp. CBMA 234]
MTVPVRWVLDQADLRTRLLGGADGVSREISLVLTTELADPAEWLSGGELVLTTGIGLPTSAPDRRRYLKLLNESGVAGVGFGIGLTFPKVPDEVVAAAEELGLPLLEIPLRTPFAAVVQRVSSHLAALQYDAVLRASRAQPRITRAVVSGGPQEVAAELGRALRASVVVLDPAGTVIASHPRNLNVTTVNLVRDAIEPGAASSATVLAEGVTVAQQSIRVGTRSHGVLGVVSETALSPVDQVLLGHANSLLALDFEKPVRLREAQQRLNEQALGLLLSGEFNLEPAWAQLSHAADHRGRIRALVVQADADANSAGDSAQLLRRVGAAIQHQLDQAGQPVFSHCTEQWLTVLLPASETGESISALVTGIDQSLRRTIRVGLSGVHPLAKLSEAVDNARLAASVAECGRPPLEFAAMAGSALLSFGESREVLVALGAAVLTPILDHDAEYGTGLLTSLRAYLEANGHWESAAAVVGVHRHTMRKRIETAEALLGCDLSVARVRAELLLAILARTPGTTD